VIKGSFNRGNITKYPYVSKGPALFMSTDEYTAQNPEWKNIVINSQVGHFINAYGIGIGNKISEYLYYIPTCVKSPWQLSGNALPPNYRFATIVPSNCPV
jgi:hypothetical protein